MGMVTVTIDGIKVEVPQGTTILEAAAEAGIHIPTLCYHPDQDIKANCRVCVCEVEGQRLLQAACSQPVSDGMVVKTNSPKAINARKMVVELILAHHPQDCLKCIRNGNCELQTLSEDLGIREVRFDNVTRALPKDKSTPAIVRDPAKCVLCGRCVYACEQIQTVGVLGKENRGHESIITTILNKNLMEVGCVMCGQCIHACPVGAIYENEQICELLAAIADPEKVVVTQMAPAVRVAVAEEVGYETGELDMLELVAGLRTIGFDKVFHTNFSADLTILEEGNELLKRLNEGGTLPMMTSCSPGWINFMEAYYPDLLDNLSTCKSPQQMFGALVKTYWAEKAGVDPKNVYSVSIMPCTAKKFEAGRPEMTDSGYADVDLVLTTRELGRLFRRAGLDFDAIEPSNFDSWMGEYTGAGVIFGATGGVMEAALRTVYEVVVGETLENLDFLPCRGMEGVKEASVNLAGTEVKVAIAHGLGNARQLMDKVRAGEADYHFIEIMCCPGGCIGGGGQPIPTTDAVREMRIEALYEEDANLPVRKSHENKEVQQLYAEFLKEPLGHKSHELLHTHYTKREKVIGYPNTSK